MARAPSSSGARADVLTWVAKVGQRLEYIGKESPRSVAVEVRRPISAGGHMPVRTGNLRNSLQASTSGVPVGNYMPAPTERLPDPMSQINGVIDSSSLGDKIFLGFRATYGVYVERKHMFVHLTAMKWSQIVRDVTERAKKVIP